MVFDPAGEYGNLVGALGGSNVAFSPDSPTRLSPFDRSDVANMATTSQMAFKIDAFLALSSAMMAEGDEGLPEADKSIITRCVEAAYAKRGGDGTPTLSDFYEILKAQPERESRDIALRYERYVKGGRFFNCQSNVTFDERIVNVDLHELSSSMRVFGMLTALEAVRNRMYANYERGVTTWLYIDEVQSLFGHPAIIEYFTKFWAEGRKFNLIATGITQNSTYMLAQRGRAQHGAELRFRAAAQAVGARQEELGRPAVAFRHRGGLHRRHRQGRRRAARGRRGAGPIRDDFPKGALYDLFNTKATEIAELKRKARREGAGL